MAARIGTIDAIDVELWMYFCGRSEEKFLVRLVLLSVLVIWAPLWFALADCPEGTWPRSLYSGPGGGMYEGPGGGLYEGPGGGMYEGPGGGMYEGPGGGMYEGPGGGMYEGPGGGMYEGPGGGLYAGPGGGLYEGPGGGLYEGPGGGLYDGPGAYCSNTPPLPVLVEILEMKGFLDQAYLIRSHLD